MHSNDSLPTAPQKYFEADVVFSAQPQNNIPLCPFAPQQHLEPAVGLARIPRIRPRTGCKYRSRTQTDQIAGEELWYLTQGATTAHQAAGTVLRCVLFKCSTGMHPEHASKYPLKLFPSQMCHKSTMQQVRKNNP